MKRCPITYDLIPANQSYSQRGLSLLSPHLTHLKPLGFTADELRQEAIARTGKMSVQGIQPKLSAVLRIKEAMFDIVSEKGTYLLKPQSADYPELPENEALTMTLASIIGIESPVHGLVYGEDNELTYFIKRFDRFGRGQKRSVEDFTQLSGSSRETKYESSMENIVKIISMYCTFPKIESVKLLKLTLFSFLIGNEDMHLKNFSLITDNNKVMLSPAYDLLNSTIVLKNAKEELALPLRGKKRNLKRADFIDYFAMERLGLNRIIVGEVLEDIERAIPQWVSLIKKSFLSEKMQTRYLELLEARCDRLEFAFKK